MKRTIFTLLIILLAAVSFIAQEKGKTVPVDSEIAAKTKRIQFWVLGSIEVPIDYSAKIIDSRKDAPYGFISSKDGKVKIGFSYGMVERAINDRNRKDFSWIKTLTIDGKGFEYGLLEKGKKKEIVAYSWVNFYQEIEKEEEIELFLGTIKTFKFGKCDECEKAR